MEEEIIDIIFENNRIRVEKIQSNGVASAAGFWYDNEIDEWVSITAGEAVLQLDNQEIALAVGDGFYIKAHVRHRVKHTSQDCEWLCVYIK